MPYFTVQIKLYQGHLSGNFKSLIDVMNEDKS